MKHFFSIATFLLAIGIITHVNIQKAFCQPAAIAATSEMVELKYQLSIKDKALLDEMQNKIARVDGVRETRFKEQVLIILTAVEKNEQIISEIILHFDAGAVQIPNSASSEKTEKRTDLQYIKPFTFETYKDYDNGRRIAYFTLGNTTENKKLQEIQEFLVDLPEIYKFQLFDKNTINKYMIECDSKVDEKFLLEKMNNLIAIQKNKQSE